MRSPQPLPAAPIHVGMVVYGSNGDIEPMVSLAQGLVSAGHTVDLFIISINRRDYSFLNGVPGIRVLQQPFPTELLTHEDVEFWRKSPQEMGELMERRHQLVFPAIVAAATRYGEMCDVLLGPQYMPEVYCVAEKFNKPYISLRPFPGHVRSDYEAPFFLPCEDFPGRSNRELWDIYDAYMNKAHKRRINKFRRGQGLLPVADISRDIVESRWLNLITYSSTLYPPPPDWSPTHHQCGFFKSPNYIAWNPSPQLQHFLLGEEQPVFITVGTMVEYEADWPQFRNQLLELAHRLDRKVIIHADWPEEGIDGKVYLLRGFVAYEKIIPACALAVHHGGVGTAHIITGLGCPSIIIHYGFEQPFNCKTLASCGVSGGSMARKDFCPDTLKDMIGKALQNKQLKQRAEQLALQLNAEDGIAQAISIIVDAYQQRNDNNSIQLI